MTARPARLFSSTTPHDVRFSLAPTLLSSPYKHADYVEEGWGQVTGRRDNLFISPLLRVADITHSEDTVLYTVADDVTYKDVVGLRNYPDFMNLIPQEEIFQVLSCIMFVRTSDGIQVLVERDTGDWPHSLELSGGFIRLDEEDVDIASFARRRVAADFQIDISKVSQIRFLGAIDFKSVCEVMNVFDVALSISFDELKRISPAAATIYALPEGYVTDDHDEHFQLPMHFPSSVVIDMFAEEL